MYTDGNLVFGYEFFYRGNIQTGHHIGSHLHPDVRCERFVLEQGEYLTGVGGRLGDICDQINFTTSTNRTFTSGGSGGNPASCVIPEGVSKPYILSIGVGLGGHIHHFKCAFINLDGLPDLEA